MNIAVKAKKRYESGRQPYLTGLSMAFVFCGFLLLMLQKPTPTTAILMVAVPLGLMAVNSVLPKLFPMDRPLLGLVNFLCALGILVQYRYSVNRGITQCFNYSAGLVAMIV